MTEEANPPVILVLTVGGSREPLETAIREVAPDTLLLIASTAGANSISSKQQAQELKTAFEGGGARRKAHVIEVPSDDPGAAFSRIGAALDSYRSQSPFCRIVADYTGGTKSMSAALLMAAFQRDLETQITTGQRENLVKVTSGTETTRDIDTRLISIERDLSTALRLASHADYAAAADLIKDIRNQIQRQRLKPSKAFNTRVEHASEWARCLRDWDRFAHQEAWETYQRAWEEGRSWANALKDSGHAGIIEDLARGKDEPRISLCQDLLANAQRRFQQGRLDDTLARLYRFTEACVQTQLYRRHQKKSGQLIGSDLPPDLRKTLVPRGDPPVYQTALRQTVEVLLYLGPKDPVATAYLDAGEHGPPWLSARNRSILAHGYTSIDPAVVNNAFTWINQHLLPAMRMEPMSPFPTTPILD